MMRRASPDPQPALLGGEGMTTKAAWHSIKKSGVHHVCSNCNTGNKIENENRRPGTGNKLLCAECRYLIAKGEC